MSEINKGKEFLGWWLLFPPGFGFVSFETNILSHWEHFYFSCLKAKDDAPVEPLDQFFRMVETFIRRSWAFGAQHDFCGMPET